jgi:D-alanine-D-alanine ligase
MKILVLFDVHRPIGPDETFSVRSLRTEEEKPTEADVLACLRKLGHEVETLAVYDEVKVVFDRVFSFKPDVVFNLCETFFSDRAHEPNIPALLELMKVPYTGAGPDALMLCKDKALAKKLLAFHRIRVARFVVSPRERPLRRLGRFSYPAFVKPVGEEASDGIARASLAKNEQEAVERARFLHERFESDALIEEYVDGRELYLGVLGNKRLTVFPPREIFFGQPPTMTRRTTRRASRRRRRSGTTPTGRSGRSATDRPARSPPASSESSPISPVACIASCTSADSAASTRA